MAKHELSEEKKNTVSSTSKRLKLDTPTSTPPTMSDADSMAESPNSVTTAIEPPEPKKAVTESPESKTTATELPEPKKSEASKSVTTTTEPLKPKKAVTESPKSEATATESPEPKKSIITNSSSAKNSPPPKPTSDISTKSEIEKYFEYHFHPTRVFTSPVNKKHPDSIPDYHFSSSILVSILSNLPPAALQHFQEEYLDDVYVFIDRIEQVKEFASVAMRFPKIGGRIKLDSRKVCDPEREKIPMQLDSEEQQKSLAEKIRKLGVWKESVREIVVLVGSEMGLDEDGFKEKLASIKPLPAKANEPLVEIENRKWINPVPEDLKVLKYREGGWSVAISCENVVANEEKQTFQLWGDIGGLSKLWKHYEAQKEDTDVELDVEKVQADKGSS
ncbi:Vacuolar protein sorting-associated protein 9a [Venturia inaequalis]|nr:Vacuolar protein sorting-associated protein 9a [Venturia inaequalis]